MNPADSFPDFCRFQQDQPEESENTAPMSPTDAPRPACPQPPRTRRLQPGAPKLPFFTGGLPTPAGCSRVLRSSPSSQGASPHPQAAAGRPRAPLLHQEPPRSLPAGASSEQMVLLSCPAFVFRWRDGPARQWALSPVVLDPSLQPGGAAPPPPTQFRFLGA